MNKLNMTVCAAAIGLAFGATAIAGTMMSKPDYTAAKKAIETDYKAMKAACDPLVANAKDICKAEAKGKEHVALAELEAAYKPSDKSRYEVRMAKAYAVYAVAKEKCDDKADNAKDVCVKEAEAAHTTAKADAKANMKTVDAKKTANEKTTKANEVAGEKSAKANEAASKKIVAANKDAAAEKREAEYALAKEKCDTLAGTPKDACVTEAKARYGKS